MHAYIFTRGQKDLVDNMMNDLQAQYLPYQTGVTPQDRKLIQMGIRPIQFWEIAFPKEQYEVVMRTLNPDILTTESKGIFRKVLSMLFKIKSVMGLKDFTPWKMNDDKGLPLPKGIIRKQAVDIKGLGIKDDPFKLIETV